MTGDEKNPGDVEPQDPPAVPEWPKIGIPQKQPRSATNTSSTGTDANISYRPFASWNRDESVRATPESTVRRNVGDAKSSSRLDAISFDTFSLPLVDEGPDSRGWSNGEQSLSEIFIDGPPGYDGWGADFIRESILAAYEYAQSSDFSLDDVDLPESVKGRPSFDLPDQYRLIDVECFEVQGAKSFLAITRLHMNHKTKYQLNFNILFKECAWILSLSINEKEPIGAREAAVVQANLGTNEAAVDTSDPYLQRWDGLISLDDDPLSRLRIMTRKLRDSVILQRQTRALEPFDVGET